MIYGIYYSFPSAGNAQATTTTIPAKKFKFLQLNFFRGTPSPLGGAIGSPGQSLARLKISGRSTP